MITVLLTRSQADCEALKDRLWPLGIRSLLAPMLTIHPFDNWYNQIKPDAKGLIFTSRHTLHVAAQHDHLKSLPLFVVGEQTAELAKRLGFQTPQQVTPSASTMAEHLLSGQNIPRKLLYLSGEHIKRNFTAELAQEGITVQRVVAYHANAAVTIPKQSVEALHNHQLNGIVFYSSRTAEIFLKLLRPMGLDKDITEQCPAFCLSEAIADTCAALGYCGPLLVAPSADTRGMITRMQQHFNL